MKALKIALIGYGKMGKAIDELALERGHTITCRITEENIIDMNSETFTKSDVAIEFTAPGSAVANIKKCFNVNLPVVVGTTGWYDRFDEVSKICKQQKQSLFYASNFSIGVNILFEINKKLAQLMNGRKEYDVLISEVHHLAKIDKPSGTAISLAEQIIGLLDKKKNWVLDKSNASVNEINIESSREENVIGKHTVSYHSDIDELIIQHNAFSRKGFAEGALLAAEFIVNKKGVFTMNDLLNQ